MRVLAVCLNPALDREFVVENFSVNKFNLVPNAKSRMSPGGKGVNVAIILSRYNVPSIVTGFIGGYVGNVLLAELRKVGKLVTTSFLHIRDETRENIAVEDVVNHTLTEINSEGPFVPAQQYEAFLRRFEVLVQKVCCVVISGSVPRGVPNSAYGELTKIAKRYGKVVFWEARDEIIVESMALAVPDVLKYDMRRSERILGRTLEDEAEYVGASKEFVKRDVKLVVLSYKKVFDFAATVDGVWKFSPGVEIDQSYLLGAGDTFVAAMVLAYLEGKCCLDLARFGYAAAVAKAMYLGKEPPSRAQIERAIGNIVVERVE